MNYSLISKLSDKEVDAIIDDVNLHYNGYNFFYAVDSYDFIHFFMPYLDQIKFTEENANYIAQEAIAYESLFSDSNSNSIILLDEYKRELLMVRNRFLEKIRHAYEIARNIESLSAEIDNLLHGPKENVEMINRNFELFLLLLIFSDRQKNMKESGFLEFMKRKVHVNHFETANDEFNSYADNAFSQKREIAFIETVYDEFVEKGIKFLNKINKEHVYKYLQNTFTDIEAIQRVFLANKTISEGNKYTNTIFYYLSSAPFKSKLIFEIVDQQYREKFNFARLFKKSRATIHRNVIQVFLANILIKEYPSHSEMPFKLLDLIKKIVNNPQGEIEPMADTATITALDNFLNKYSSEIENHFYSHLLKNYKGTLQEIISGGMSMDDLQKKLLGNFSEFLQDQDDDPDAQKLYYNISLYEKLLSLKEAVQFQKDIVKIKFGKDIIRFHYHHLPYLLFLFDKDMHKNRASFYEAMQIISDIDSDTEFKKEELISFIKDLLKQKSQNTKRQIFDLLILIFIDILSIHNFKGDTQNFEKELIETLEKQRRIIKKIKKKHTQSQGNPPTDLQNELIYVLLWLYRRNNMFEELKDLEKSLTGQQKEDPRIIHGLGLASIAKYYDDRDNKDPRLLENAIEHLQGAVSGYTILCDTIDGPVNTLLTKNLIAVYNSLSNSNLLLYKSTRKLEYVKNARDMVEKMKSYTDESGIKYDDLPIPNNTEAELEYCEAEIFFNKNEFDLAKRKLKYARRRYEKSQLRPSLMDDRFYEVGKKITTLQDKIKANEKSN